MASMVLEGLSRTEILEIALKRNLFKTQNRNEVQRLLNVLFKRLDVLDEIILLKIIDSGDRVSSILCLYGIIKTDSLFRSFLKDLAAYSCRVGSRYINSDEVADTTVRESVSVYIDILRESGIIAYTDVPGKFRITPPVLPTYLINYIREIGDADVLELMFL